jgi:hypothetical protein
MIQAQKHKVVLDAISSPPIKVGDLPLFLRVVPIEGKAKRTPAAA